MSVERNGITYDDTVPHDGDDGRSRGGGSGDTHTIAPVVAATLLHMHTHTYILTHTTEHSRTLLVQAATRRTGDREWPDSRLRVRTRRRRGASHRDTPHSALLTLYSLSRDFNNFSLSSLQFLCIGLSCMKTHDGDILY
jgi:hypothetical protein